MEGFLEQLKHFKVKYQESKFVFTLQSEYLKQRGI